MDRDTLVQKLQEAAARTLKHKEKEYARMVAGMTGIVEGEEPRVVAERMAEGPYLDRDPIRAMLCGLV